MNKNLFLSLIFLSISGCNSAQAMEISASGLSDAKTTSEILGERVQNVISYLDFAKKQLDMTTAHPKFALEISVDSSKYEKGECKARLIEWKMGEKLFSEALFFYKHNDLESGDKKLSYAFNCVELTVIRSAKYWCRREDDLQMHTPGMIMRELLDAISDIQGSPAKYPGARERLLESCIDNKKNE
ncbi:MAG: hypothetical protein IJ730_02715 [Alphaproteobacteria bacterium]|nr:hypothetical protein [Alphaproteobacteria bacterium]